MGGALNLGQYLFARLRQLGVQSIHGVPGDFTLPLLDYVKPAGLRWIGSCNELNAGYAADGYARVKGISALSTTYGVGELSALNAVAGSYAEYTPVVRTSCGVPCNMHKLS
jgi:pyruvate decarboxylase